MIVCVYPKWQKIPGSLDVTRNVWRTAYSESNLRDYVQKITLEKSDYLTAGFATSDLNICIQ